MAKAEFIGEFEQLVLLAVLRRGEDAYGVTIGQEIHRQTGRRTSRGALYVTLERLEKKGYLKSRLADSSQQRMGRPRRYYRLCPEAMQVLRTQRQALLSMWNGFEEELEPSS